MIRLLPIDRGNYEECLSLTVSQDQQAFIATNQRSLAQAYIYRDRAHPYAIYDDDRMVGFAMLILHPAKDDFYLWRFMIDQRYQGRGYGKAAMRLVLDIFREAGAKSVGLDYEKTNTVADALYRGYGFVPTGEVIGDLVVMTLDVTQPGGNT